MTLGETVCNNVEQMRILGNGVTNTHRQWGEKTCQRGATGARQSTFRHAFPGRVWLDDGW